MFLKGYIRSIEIFTLNFSWYSDSMDSVSVQDVMLALKNCKVNHICTGNSYKNRISFMVTADCLISNNECLNFFSNTMVLIFSCLAKYVPEDFHKGKVSEEISCPSSCSNFQYENEDLDCHHRTEMAI